MGICLELIYALFKQDGCVFASAMLWVFMFKSVRVGLVHLLPCYVKSVLLPSQRGMCRGGTWRYGLACVSSYSVFRIKEERRLFCLLLV